MGTERGVVLAPLEIKCMINSSTVLKKPSSLGEKQSCCLTLHHSELN